MRRVYRGRFYSNFIEEVGVADAELNRDVRVSVRRFLNGLSGDNPVNNPARELLVPEGGGLLDATGGRYERPRWLSEEDLEILAGLFSDKGFTGGLNWYRNLDRNWALTSPLEGARLRMPALYIGGERDTVMSFYGMEDLIRSLIKTHDQFREPLILPGCGHWTQEERPEEVNRALLDFLAALD